MITLEEAIKAWKSKTTVINGHPMIINPIKCRIVRIEYLEKANRLLRIVLLQPPGNSYIRALPEHISLESENIAEKPVIGKFSKEVNAALEELERIKAEGFQFNE